MSFQHHPQTPQSPSQSSPTTSDPMTSSMSSIPSVTVTLPTPAHSVNGSSMPSDNSQDHNIGEDASHKRKRASDDEANERERKKMHIYDDRVVIENIHLDVGDKYLFCRTPHPIAFPRLSDDLYELFGLSDLAAEFARVLPNGEKNAIRKTYKGHIKKLGVNGHFDSVKADPKSNDSLLAMMSVPDEEWNVHFVRNREMEGGFSADTRAKLPKAMSMAKGSVPKHIWDSSVLGELGPASTAKAEKQTGSAKATAPGTPIPALGAGTAAGTAAAAGAGAATSRPKLQQPPAQEAARPKRAGKKRSYGDSSFEGYGDGYPDDDMALEAGYSTGEGEGGVGTVKRRKKNPGSAQQYPQIRQAYGPGMVGA